MVQKSISKNLNLLPTSNVIGIEVVSLSGSIAVYVRRHGARKKTLLCDDYHDSD